MHDDNDITYGIEKDYPMTSSKRQDFDGWQQYLISQINDKLGPEINRKISIDTSPYDGKILAKISISKSNKPVFTNEKDRSGGFYVRVHGQTENLNPEETNKWVEGHFRSYN